ncbi:hypothetical protein OH76DRAFT_794358 [Lentinus brumalis]|uniref:CTCK domain-containing protein n=1 Tax=Lentinus brumalis TaxID=2498619 RepID=A0A371D3H4_9APHY|nr:hypothetical protein OH76DRAFT_794358 [Polyporus brumalis]
MPCGCLVAPCYSVLILVSIGINYWHPSFVVTRCTRIPIKREPFLAAHTHICTQRLSRGGQARSRACTSRQCYLVLSAVCPTSHARFQADRNSGLGSPSKPHCRGRDHRSRDAGCATRCDAACFLPRPGRVYLGHRICQCTGLSPQDRAWRGAVLVMTGACSLSPHLPPRCCAEFGRVVGAWRIEAHRTRGKTAVRAKITRGCRCYPKQ